MISFLFEGVTDVLDTSQRIKAGAHLVLELFLRQDATEGRGYS